MTCLALAHCTCAVFLHDISFLNALRSCHPSTIRPIPPSLHPPSLHPISLRTRRSCTTFRWSLRPTSRSSLCPHLLTLPPQAKHWDACAPILEKRGKIISGEDDGGQGEHDNFRLFCSVLFLFLFIDVSQVWRAFGCKPCRRIRTSTAASKSGTSKYCATFLTSTSHTRMSSR